MADEMLSVKEWGKRAGLKLVNYDGFVREYEKLLGESDVDFSTNLANRMRNAGEMLCTRRAFQAGIYGCTIQFPTIDDYESMLEVIPDFVEDNITNSISIDGKFNKKQNPKSKVEMLLKAMKIKLKAREMRLELATMLENISFDEIEGRLLDSKELEQIKKYGEDVVSAEIRLMREIIDELEKLLEKNIIVSRQIPNKKIELLLGLYYETSKVRRGEVKEEEYMVIDIPGIPKEPFVQPYRIIGTEGITTGVAFDIQDEHGRVRGAMKTTPEMDQRIRRKIKDKDIKDEDIIDGEIIGREIIDENTIEESGQDLSIRDKGALPEIASSLEIIDAEIVKEDRQGFMAKLEMFINRIRDFFKKDGESR